MEEPCEVFRRPTRYPNVVEDREMTFGSGIKATSKAVQFRFPRRAQDLSFHCIYIYT